MRRTLALVLVVGSCALGLTARGQEAPATSQAPATPEKKEYKPKGVKLFDPYKVHTARIRLSAEDYAQLEPRRASERILPRAPRVVPPLRAEDGALRIFGLRVASTRPAATQPAATQPAATQPAAAAAEAPQPPPEPVRVQPTGFGMEYTYVHGTLEFDGQTFRDVGIRYKGNFSFTSHRNSPRKPFKIDLDRFGGKDELKGLKKVNFHNNALDPSQVREAFSYWAFRQAGVPAPRTSFVLLYLAVEGRPEQCLGLYTVVEELDSKDFLGAHFGRKDGLVLKPEGMRGAITHLGDSWAPYVRRYNAKTDGTPAAQQAFIRFTRAATHSDIEEFRRELAETMDVDEYLRFLAVTVLLSNMDGPLGMGHNFILYVDESDPKVKWLPWDMNLSLGSWQRVGSSEDLTDLSITRPWFGNATFIQKVLDTPEWRERYLGYLREYTTTWFSAENAAAELERLEAAVAEADRMAGSDMAGGGEDGAEGGGGPVLKRGVPASQPATTVRWYGVPEPRDFVAARVRSVTEQLEGQHTGYAPRYRDPLFGRGAGGPMGADRQPPVPVFAIRVFRAADADAGKHVTVEEAAAMAGRFFDDAVAGDGKTDPKATLTEAPLKAAFDGVLPQEARPAPRAGEGRGWFNRGGRRPSPRAPDRGLGLARFTIAEADRDLDGKVTRDELVRTAQRLVREADQDADGKLSSEEFTRLVGFIYERAERDAQQQQQQRR